MELVEYYIHVFCLDMSWCPREEKGNLQFAQGLNTKGRHCGNDQATRTLPIAKINEKGTPTKKRDVCANTHVARMQASSQICAGPDSVTCGGSACIRRAVGLSQLQNYNENFWTFKKNY